MWFDLRQKRSVLVDMTAHCHTGAMVYLTTLVGWWDSHESPPNESLQPRLPHCPKDRVWFADDPAPRNDLHGLGYLPGVPAGGNI